MENTEPGDNMSFSLERQIGFFYTSEKNDEILPAFHKAVSEIAIAIKDADNPFHKSKYADLASCKRASDPALKANNLSMVQPSNITDEGKAIIINTTIFHQSGQYLRWEFTLPLGTKLDAQEVGKAVTYARRYALSGLGLVTDIDDDGNNASGHDRQGAPPPRPQQQRKDPPKPEPQAAPKAEVPKQAPASNSSSLDSVIGEVSSANNVQPAAIKKFLASTGISEEPEELQVKFLKLYAADKGYSKVAQRWKTTGKDFATCLQEAEENTPAKLSWATTTA